MGKLFREFNDEKWEQVRTHPYFAKTIEAIKNNTITATIVQQPKLQGSRPLDILADYLLLNITPTEEMCLCECGIRIFENVW